MTEKEIVEDSVQPNGWSRAEKLLMAAVVLFLLNLFLLGLTEVQIQSREETLDSLEESITLIEDDAEAIRKVADASAASAEQGQAVQEAFLQLVQTVEALEYEVCGGPCPTPPESQSGG